MKAEDPLSELQLRGLAAAAEVFDRFAAELGGSSARNGTPPPPSASNGASPSADPIGQQQLRSAAARMIDLFAGLFQQTFETYIELAQAIVQPSGGDIAMSAGAADNLALDGQAGRNAGTTVWIHNATAEPAGDVVLALTDLTAHTGERIDASLARFVPGALDVGAGASACAMLSLAIPLRAEPGVYYGHVLAANLPCAGLPVRLVVEGSDA
jgi:hypothetical protein